MTLRIFNPSNISADLPEGLTFRLFQQEQDAEVVAIVKVGDSINFTTVSDEGLLRYLLPTLVQTGNASYLGDISNPSPSTPPIVPPTSTPAAPQASVAFAVPEIPNPLSDYAQRIEVAERSGDLKALKQLQLEMIEMADKQAPTQQEISLGGIPELDALEKSMTNWR